MKKKKLISNYYEKYLNELQLESNEVIKQILTKEDYDYLVK